jgi:hypothetical protein
MTDQTEEARLQSAGRWVAQMLLWEGWLGQLRAAAASTDEVDLVGAETSSPPAAARAGDQLVRTTA